MSSEYRKPALIDSSGTFQCECGHTQRFHPHIAIQTYTCRSCGKSFRRPAPPQVTRLEPVPDAKGKVRA